MMQLVQATCPGCRHPLRIPSDWLSQAFRCKHCGQVLAARGSAAVMRPPVAAPPAKRDPQPSGSPFRRTPLPATRPSVAPAAPPERHVMPASALPAARPAYPTAAPVANASPFDALERTDPGPSRRRRRSSGGGWKGLVLALSVLSIAGVVTAVSWDKISSAILPSDEEQKDGEKVALNTPNPGSSQDTAKDQQQPKKPTPPSTAPRRTPPTKPDADRPRPPDTGKRPPNPPPPPPPRDPTKEPNHFPRRALVISVHNYLYANPVSYGIYGPGGHNVGKFLEQLAKFNGFRIPLTQIAHLSDSAEKGMARAPMRSVIEKTLKDFLDSSRAQDHLMVFFIGHALVVGDDAYLVPIEGELDNAATLIPLKWVYEQLAACKARQKVLVLDVNRFSSTRGLERPDAGEMDAKFEKAVKEPPAGVQVWAACSAGQKSYETDDAPQGCFIEALYVASQKGIPNKIQSPDDPLPLEYFKDKVDEQMASDLKRYKLQQVSILGGKMAEEGAPYDKSEPLPPTPTLASVPKNKDNEKLVRAVLDQISTPGVKPGQGSEELNYDALPPFDADVLKKYDDDKGTDDSPLRKAVRNARALLWAVSTSGAPANLNPEVDAARQKLKFNLSVLAEGFRAPPPAQENAFKGKVEENERHVARIMGQLQEALEELKAAGENKGAEPKRWQANYDFMLARLESQIAFLYEYQSMLGQMRKELPPRDPTLHGGWRLAATTTLQGDSTGKKLFKDSRKILKGLAEKNAGTPWEVLAKREMLTALGLEWKPTR
jgi:hypothetical protein